VDGAEVGVLKKPDKVRLCGLLEGHDGGTLEPQVRLELLGNLTDEALEGELADEKIGRFLVAANFTEGDRTRAVAVALLGSGRRFGRDPACSLALTRGGGVLLPFFP
jgi:hypothetical protein